MQTYDPKSNDELRKEIERLKDLLQERESRLKEAQETLDAIRTGAVDGIVRITPEGEQIFILKGSDEPYRILIEKMNEGAVLVGETGMILYCNLGFAELIGAPLDKVIGTNVSDWVSARNVEVLNDIMSGNRKNEKRFEIAFQTTKQKLIPTQVSLSKILFGSVNASALVVTDLTKHMEGEIKRYTANLEEEITQRKKAEEALRASEQKLEEYSKNLKNLVEERTKQLKDSERLAAIGATAGMVGHDIRNPLQAITGDVYLLRDYLSGMPDTISVKHDVAESLDEIEKNIGYINKIVADLQDYSRPIKPELRNLNLYELVIGAFRNIEIPENVSPTIEIDSKIDLKTDATLLTRIFNNLVINSIQAMPSGGNLSIVATQTQDSLVLSIQDTGVGIPDHIKPKLFTPMTTTKAKGQGLGLAVVKRLVEALKGTISFESEEGKGTKFIIELPTNQ